MPFNKGGINLFMNVLESRTYINPEPFHKWFDKLSEV